MCLEARERFIVRFCGERWENFVREDGFQETLLQKLWEKHSCEKNNCRQN